MNNKDNSRTFPYPWPWENLEPTWVKLQSLRADVRYRLRLDAARNERLIGTELNQTNVAKIAGALHLEDGQRVRLANDFELIVSWYLGPGLQRELDIDVKACRRELSRMAKAAAELASALRQIDTMVGPTFRHLYEAASIGETTVDDRDLFLRLDDQLGRTERVARNMTDALKPKRRGRAGEFFRNTAVSLICEALSEAGAAPVRVSHGKGDRAGTHLHFSNNSGRALLGLFGLLDHQIDESLLVRSFECIRKKTPKQNLAQKSLPTD